jgi:ParB-like chromosome segregation protein Spo0J
VTEPASAVLEQDHDDRVEWRGSEALRQFLIRIDDLEPFPGNPNRGNVEAIRRSLRRFGQYAPITTDADNGRRIVAGHHVRLAAKEEGWTHIAAVPHEFRDIDEARAALLADNRIAELGDGQDTELLIAQLQSLAEIDALEGTGYTSDDLDYYLAEIAKITAPLDPIPDAATPAEPDAPPGTKEVVLFYNLEQLADVERWIKIVAGERGTSGVSETVYEALRFAAEHLNQDA